MDLVRREVQPGSRRRPYVISASEDSKRSASPLNFPVSNLALAKASLTPRDSGAFALKSRAGEKHPCGDVAVHQSKNGRPDHPQKREER
jgi:hypothetical protein